MDRLPISYVKPLTKVWIASEARGPPFRSTSRQHELQAVARTASGRKVLVSRTAARVPPFQALRGGNMSTSTIRGDGAGPYRRRTRRLRLSKRTTGVLSTAALLAMGIAIPALAVTGSPSGFESGDGNMVLNTSGNTDWNCFVNSDGFAHNGSTPSGCAITTGAV